ncbi:MAG: hypothetical protein HC821_03275 [Lewinella sp.]|nr:hypothetical protein [Lewinella sp.]
MGPAAVVAAAPYGLAAYFVLFGLSIYSNALEHRTGIQDFYQLMAEVEKEDFRNYLLANPNEESLYFVSLCSQALYLTAQRFPQLKAQIVPKLAAYANWVVDARRFSEWRMAGQWNESVFFLAHAGIVLGHYQELSKDERHASPWRKVAEFLGRAIPNSPFKNLESRRGEEVYRPADNAAALYALQLYDRYYATEWSTVAAKNWLDYQGRELRFDESRLPCSAFSTTNTCKLDPTASALGMMVGYLAAAQDQAQPQYYSEWKHYFNVRWALLFSPNVRSGMRGKADPRFCDLAAYPLGCENNLNALGMWLAAANGGHYNYARFLGQRMLRGSEPIKPLRPQRRCLALTDLCLRVMAQMQP